MLDATAGDRLTGQLPEALQRVPSPPAARQNNACSTLPSVSDENIDVGMMP
ncbi:hypothetical protein KXD97_00010 [Mycobacterium sp. SMC-8]|nr:hypothetical protein KXD97_00010 [Mycobacterium sp. SMC-8]